MHHISFALLEVFTIGVYARWLLRMRKNWTEQSDALPNKHSTEGISIIIAFRNEEKNLPKLLEHLLVQEYQTEVEFIFVNDHSEDGGKKFLDRKRSRDQRIRVTYLPQGVVGKKNAIRHGLAQARFENIITIDADVQMGRLWLHEWEKAFSTDNDLIIGPVGLSGRRLIQKLQSLEMLVLTGLAAASAFEKKAVLCNGANLGFRKAVFYQLNEIASDLTISSGDDMFLLHRMKMQSKKIGYLKSEHAMVYTEAANWKTFLPQRIRWAGKTQAVGDEDANTAGKLILGINVISFLLLVLPLFQVHHLYFSIPFFILKFAIELLFLRPIALFFRQNRLLFLTPLLTIVYPLYTITIVITSLFFRPKWKGRIVSLAGK